MKKIGLLLTVLAIAGSSYGQVPILKKLKLSTHFGYVAPSGGGGGFGYAIEPGFVITDKIAANFRFEGTIFTRELEDPAPGASLDVGVGGIASYTVNGVYYLMDGKFKPFVGLGFGLYNPANVEVTVSTGGNTASSTTDLEADPAFGFYPRIGFNLGHLNFLIDYNIVGDSESESSSTTVDPNTGNSTTTTSKTTFENSYLMVKLGFTIGGGGH